MVPQAAMLLNVLSLYAVALVLGLGFVFQLVWHELPCPLCLLQRVAFLGLAIGPILNIRHGPRPSHYAMSLLAAVVGMVVAVRQVLLHILPGDPGYGSAVAGLHYYTWAMLFFVLAIVLIALALLLDRQFTSAMPPRPPALARLAVWLVIAVAAANTGATLLECGFTWCPEDPVKYELLINR